MNRKRTKKFWPSGAGIRTPNFQGDEIKSKQASKRDRTLLSFKAPSFSAYGLFFKNDEGRLLKRGFTYENWKCPIKNSNLMWKLICSYIYLYNVVNLL